MLNNWLKKENHFSLELVPGGAGGFVFRVVVFLTIHLSTLVF